MQAVALAANLDEVTVVHQSMEERGDGKGFRPSATTDYIASQPSHISSSYTTRWDTILTHIVSFLNIVGDAPLHHRLF